MYLSIVWFQSLHTVTKTAGQILNLEVTAMQTKPFYILVYSVSQYIKKKSKTQNKTTFFNRFGNIIINVNY